MFLDLIIAVVVSITISINIRSLPFPFYIIKLGIICDRLSLSELLETIGVDGREMEFNGGRTMECAPVDLEM